MKKNVLFLACCIGLMFFASCKKGDPTITIATGTQYVNQSTQVFSGDQITVGFSTTGENLTKVEMNAMQNGTVLYTNTQNINNESSYLYAHNFVINAIGTVTITGIVTDAQGRTATKSFDINCYEKPNAKFIGRYEGEALFTGNATTTMQGYENIPFENQPLPTIIDMEAGDNVNEVLAVVLIDEQTNTVKGVVDGDKVTFEAVSSPFDLSYGLMSISIDMTFNIVGTLNNGKLDLEGSCQGGKDINIPFVYTGPLTIQGTIGGSLNKVQ
jgi:hypothetical protein